MIDGGLHDSSTVPSMFARAGGTTPKKAASVNDTMSWLSPKPDTATRVGDCPAKVIDS